MAEEPRDSERENGDRKPVSRHPLVRSGFLEYDRVVFFSDAVFAIAITLLAVNLRVPEHGHVSTGKELSNALPGIRGFAISFVVIAFFWVGHHQIFRYITALDRRMIAMNLLFLGTIAFLPYPTDVLSSASGGQAGAVIFYAACGALAGLVEGFMWLYASTRANLTSQDIGEVRWFFFLRIMRVPVVFLLSIPIAVFSPTSALYFWILIWASALVINHYAPNLEISEQLD
ncbi:MAG TPA: TMEM175 family protein [Streptosporangiaceae bacterium]|nr:TMEM175 family protein [Streptosporangiaceae bacterium]